MSLSRQILRDVSVLRSICSYESCISQARSLLFVACQRMMSLTRVLGGVTESKAARVPGKCADITVAGVQTGPSIDDPAWQKLSKKRNQVDSSREPTFVFTQQ
jgi:hypothetical protein